jgi:hypothetical protein
MCRKAIRHRLVPLGELALRQLLLALAQAQASVILEELVALRIHPNADPQLELEQVFEVRPSVAATFAFRSR